MKTNIIVYSLHIVYTYEYQNLCGFNVRGDIIIYWFYLKQKSGIDNPFYKCQIEFQ